MGEKNTFTVLLFIKKTKLHSNGEAPIYLRITVRGESKEFSANMSVPIDHWDVGKKAVKNGVKDANDKNNYLRNLKLKVQSCKREIIERGQTLSAQAIVDAYLGNDEQNRGVLDIFQEHNEKIAELSGIEFAPATIQKYKACRTIVKNFIKKKYKKEDVPINSVNHEFLKELEHYIKTIRKCGHNSAIKYLQNFKKIIIIGINNGWVKEDPYQKIKYKRETTHPIYLDEAELTRIQQKKITIDRLARVRDIFIFCCFTGLAYIDVKNLRVNDVIVNHHGKRCIRKARQKTKVMSYIPLLGIPEQILAKYESDPICIEQGGLLPVLSNQKMNSYLKELADICGIDKPLRMHTARHTFATTVTLSNNVPMEVVSEMLGHSSIIMTKHYAKVVNNHISNEMGKIEKKYSSKQSVYKVHLDKICNN
jgi:site-specific recombinase XerD